MRKGLMIVGIASMLMLGVVAGACSPAANNDGGAKLSVSGVDSMAFNPSTLSAKAGSVTVEFKNEGALSHTFTIDSLNVHIVAAGGATQTGTFSPAVGTYEFYCKEPGHQEAGMKGTLTVS